MMIHVIIINIFDSTNNIIGYSISMEKDSCCWVGTNKGLFRYKDGNVQIFDSTNSQIPFNHIIRVAIDKNNNKWLVSVRWDTNYTYSVLKYNDTIWTIFNTTNSLLRPTRITNIAVDSSNNIWLSSLSGLAKYDSTWHFYDSTSIPLNKTNATSFVKTDKHGIIWVGTLSAVLKYQNNAWTKITNIDYIIGAPTSIAEDTCGNFGGIGSNNQFAIYKQGGISGRIRIFDKSDSILIYDDSLQAVSFCSR